MISSAQSLPKISIVTPSYNQGGFIEETILSVLNQNYPNLEYIIIDGGSTDTSVSIIRKFESQLAYWVSEKDAGQSDAINKGFRKATGDICCYLNSDDLLLPGSLSVVAQNFTEKKIAWLSGACLAGPTVETSAVYPCKPATFPSFINEMGIWQQSTFWSSDVMPKDYFDSGFQFRMDHDFFIRLYAKEGSPFVVENSLAFFRLHENAKTSQCWDVSLREWKILVDREKKHSTGALHDAICHHEALKILHRQIAEVLNRKDSKASTLATLGKLLFRNSILFTDRMIWGALKRTVLS